MQNTLPKIEGLQRSFQQLVTDMKRSASSMAKNGDALGVDLPERHALKSIKIFYLYLPYAATDQSPSCTPSH